VLLVDEVERELVLVGADLVTDAAFPRAGQAVQRRVQEVHAAFEEQDAAVLTADILSTPCTVCLKSEIHEKHEIHWLKSEIHA